MARIQFDKISKQFGDVAVINDQSLTIESGELLVLLVDVRDGVVLVLADPVDHAALAVLELAAAGGARARQVAAADVVIFVLVVADDIIRVVRLHAGGAAVGWVGVRKGGSPDSRRAHSGR